MGLVLRALRRRLGWRQVDLANAAQASQSGVSRAERGHVEELTVAQLRRLFGAVDARLAIAPSWRGAALERLLDEEHARLVSAVATILSRAGWTVELEATILGTASEARSMSSRRIRGTVPRWSAR